MTITLATLDQATAQEVFDQVVNHLRAQGQKSVKANDNYACAYRGQGGLMCAAGCLIGDDEYSSKWDLDGGTVWSQVAYDAEVHAHTNLINSLQAVHDGDEVEHWEENFARVANQFGLFYTYAPDDGPLTEAQHDAIKAASGASSIPEKSFSKRLF